VRRFAVLPSRSSHTLYPARTIERMSSASVIDRELVCERAEQLRGARDVDA
jgi:hypothetical protein